jgi:alkanesulfonate monooxygenase SsuD/methylene tetrahydromethanopterin reductase-like flavin-dependent oxidoreductase (luciferase family)
MSGGRAELGLGAGWFEKEHQAYGIPFPPTGERFDRFAEQVEIIRGLLTTPAGETYSFDGKHYTVTDSPALPKPVQSPLPIVLGGEGRRRSADLAARFADEYNVNFKTVEDTRAVVDRVRAAVSAAGRDLVYSAAQTMCVGKDDAQLARRAEALGRDLDDLRRTGIAGTPAEVVDKLGAFASVGVSRVYLQTLDLDDLDHLELVASEVLPQV